MQEDTRVGVGPLALESEVAAVAVWLYCDDPTRRMHFASGYTSRSDLAAREVLDRVPSDAGPGPRVMGVDAASHHPMRDTKGLPDRAGAILHEGLHAKYLACGGPRGSVVDPLHRCGGLAACGAQQNARTAPRLPR